jgi:RNA polymerase sigma-70 factor (ECF subfamily)
MYRIRRLLDAHAYERAFRLIIQYYQDKIMRFISFYIANNEVCEEITSDIFVTLWTKRYELSKIKNLESYVFIMARNKAIDYLRLNKKKWIELDAIEVDVFHNTETTPESIYISNEIIENLNAEINKLPHKTKLAFQLIREEKMKFKDAAEILGVSVKTLEKQVFMAISILHDKLRKK